MEHHLMPQKGNYCKANFFGNRLVLIIFSFISIFGLGFSIPASVVLAEINLTVSISSEALTTLTNRERAKNNLPVLEQNDLLQKAAELKANDMIKRGYFSHNAPDGKLPWHYINQVGYKYKDAGENLAVDFFDSSETIKAWMNSPGHRENILKKEYTQIGTAVVQGVFKGEESVFVVQFFGTPQEVSYVKKINSEPKTTVVSSRKVVEITKKKITPSKKPNMLVQETTQINQYPRFYYVYDNGRECIIV